MRRQMNKFQTKDQDKPQKKLNETKISSLPYRVQSNDPKVANRTWENFQRNRKYF